MKTNNKQFYAWAYVSICDPHGKDGVAIGIMDSGRTTFDTRSEALAEMRNTSSEGKEKAKRLKYKLKKITITVNCSDL